LYCLKVCSFQLMENRRVSILKLMGMWRYPYIVFSVRIIMNDSDASNNKIIKTIKVIIAGNNS
ncbi:hypothetical protein ACQVRG_28935, partial [Bacillus cereus]